MKPLTLTMSAFGSYGEPVVIDFTKADHGLFLITGDTGSGKTTIFDGITFALYGETSGGMRDGKMMRSHYAFPSEETYVELTFSYRGQVYKVRRAPEYMREGKRKNSKGGLVKSPAMVELTLPDGSVYRGKARETDKKLCEIMGIDREQFTQIAMIAQGDFLKLLLAKSEDRKKIFSRIFNTDRYRAVEEELNGRRKELREGIGASDERVQAYIQGIRFPEGENTKESLSVSSAEALLRQYLEADEEQLKKMELPFLEADRLYNETLEERGRKKADNESIERFLCAKKDWEKQKEEETDYEKRRMLCEAAGRAFGVKVHEERKNLAESHAADSAKQWEKAAKAFEAALGLCRERGVLEADAGDMISVLTDLKGQENQFHEARIRKQEVRKKQEQVKEEEALCDRQREELQKMILVQAKAREQYGALEEQFFCEQAGILARERLRQGEPCPVCGSIEHPAPAVIAGEAVTEEQVKNARKEWEKKQQACDSLRLRIQAESAKINEIKRQLKEELDKIPEDLEEREAAVKRKIQAVEAMISAKNQYTEKEKEKKQRKAERDMAHKGYLEALKEAGFSEEASYKEALFPWKNRKELEEERKRTDGYFSNLHGMETALKALEAGVLGKQYTDLSELESRLEEAKKRREQLLAEKGELESRIQANSRIQKALREEKRKYESLREQAALYENLWQVAAGQVKGRVRMDFETYVQRMYFEKILAAANRRFLTFTNGRMKLKSRPVEDMGHVGAAGLELNVYVMATGKERDVKTLSGGESFLASLSLALGLSDVVQSQAGAVRLESMFVDEGFGALDEGTREQAVRVLNDLAGDDRLVGIISHVDALKDSIGKKLVVEKTSHGSRIAWDI